RKGLVALRVIPQFVSYRLNLYQFEGKLLKVRRIEPSQALKLAGTTELYEALLVPLDEPMSVEKDKVLQYAISFVFTELPPSLAAVKEKTVNTEWLNVDLWATVAGYFFKVTDDKIPILIGKSATVLKSEPVAPGPDPAAIDRNLRVYRLIKDESKIEENWEE